MTSLFPLVLLSMRTVAASPRTFTNTDPNTGMSVVCDSCPPGTYLRARCTSTSKSDCAPCPSGSFTELWNYIPKCLRCGICGQHQVEKTACTADKDCQCECKQGYYYKKKFDMCLCHSECHYGEGVLTKGRSPSDTGGREPVPQGQGSWRVVVVVFMEQNYLKVFCPTRTNFVHVV